MSRHCNYKYEYVTLYKSITIQFSLSLPGKDWGAGVESFWSPFCQVESEADWKDASESTGHSWANSDSPDSAAYGREASEVYCPWYHTWWCSKSFIKKIPSKQTNKKLKKSRRQGGGKSVPMSILGHWLSGPRVSQQEANCSTECIVLGSKPISFSLLLFSRALLAFPSSPCAVQEPLSTSVPEWIFLGPFNSPFKGTAAD